MKKSKMIRSAAISAVMLAGACMANAQESVLMLMKDLPQQVQYNPALATSSRSYFVLPGLGGLSMSLENTAFCFEDMYVYDKKKDEWALNIDHLAKNFKQDNNVMHLGLDIPILATGVSLPKGAIFWSIANKSIMDVTLPKGILDLRYGNYDYDKQKPISHDLSDLGMNLMNYNELALGGHYDINENLSIGATVKYLSGLMAMHTDDLSLKMETKEQNGKYTMHVVSKGHINIAAPMTITEDKDGYVDDIDVAMEDALGFMTKNSGVAFDLGAKMTFLDKRLRIGVSVTDLGFINWKVDINRLDFDADFVYEGKDVSGYVTDVDKENEKDYWDEIGDELAKFKDMKSKSGESFKTKLTPKMIAFGQWEIKKWFNVGAVASLKFVNGNALAKTTANISLRPNHHFEFLFSTGMHPGANFGIGGGIQATAGPFQIVLASERASFNAKQSKGAQISLGINWLIGAGSNTKTTAEATATEMPQ